MRLALVSSCFANAALAADGADLFDMSLEELINIEVTSVSRKSQSLAETASSVYVVTQEDIRRYGIRSVPEALRLVPGLSVSQIDASKWAIGSRGFSGQFANKLLVMMDGRVLYVTAFSGVFWDVQDTLISEIDRIEVIRGPGSSVWGANAVNGVINIITTPADGEAGGGLQTRVEEDGSISATALYSGEFGESLDYRVFVKHQDIEGNVDLDARDTADAWQFDRVGLRADWQATDRDELTFIAEAYDGDFGASYLDPGQTPPFLPSVVESNQATDGHFLTTRWSREHAEDANTFGQLTIESDYRNAPFYEMKRRTVQLDIQHQKTLSRHDLVFGMTYAQNEYELGQSERVSGFPEDTHDTTVNVFVQDDWTVIPEKLRLILGTKIEDHDLSMRHYDVMPTLRVHWSIGETLSAWAAVTRAIRMPSHADRHLSVVDISAPLPPGDPNNPFPLTLRTSGGGSPDFDSEELDAFEIGLRGRLRPRVTFDLSLFDMRYEDLSAIVTRDFICNPSGISLLVDPTCIAASDSVIADVAFANAAWGTMRGGEFAVDWDVTESWRLRMAVSRAAGDFEAQPQAQNFLTAMHPERQANVRSEWTVNGAWSIAASLRYVDDITELNIPGYWATDVQLNVALSNRWRLAIGGKNIFDEARLEYVSELNELLPTQIERAFFVQADWSF